MVVGNDGPETGAPFSIRVLADGAANERSDQAADWRRLLDTMPAVYRSKSGELCRFKDDIQGIIIQEFNLQRVSRHQHWLWLAGPLTAPMALHQHPLAGREIALTERMDTHLVWRSRRVFVKPMPRFLLEPQFWTDYLCKSNDDTGSHRPHAIGFLLSYVALIRCESDLLLAQENSLMPSEVRWCTWRALVQELDLEVLAEHAHPRFWYAELKMSHLNFLAMLFHGPSFGNMAHGGGVRSFLSSKFQWVAALTVYVVIVLTALQVGLATERLGRNATFQSVSYGFTVFSILWPFMAGVCIFLFWGCLLLVNFVHAREMNKRVVRLRCVS